MLTADLPVISHQDGQDPDMLLDTLLPLLRREPQEVDHVLAGDHLARVLAGVDRLAGRRATGDHTAFRLQQLLLARLYELELHLPEGPTAEGSVALHSVRRRLEDATAAAEDEHIDPAVLQAEPEDPQDYVRWLRGLGRNHRAYKHPFYEDFLRHEAGAEEIRDYVVQESSVDGRFDDLLALMQVGTSGAAKLEIAENYWDEMGNGDPAGVHTALFSRIFDSLGITDDDLAGQLGGEALLSGNLAVMVCRYRRLYGEAVGLLAMTEWLVPARFSHVLHAWGRLGLPREGIIYHELHIGIDARHASGWFNRVVMPAATSPHIRRGMTRGALWRLNSSARYLDQQLAMQGSAAAPA